MVKTNVGIQIWNYYTIGIIMVESSVVCCCKLNNTPICDEHTGCLITYAIVPFNNIFYWITSMIIESAPK